MRRQQSVWLSVLIVGTLLPVVLFWIWPKFHTGVWQFAFFWWEDALQVGLGFALAMLLCFVSTKARRGYPLYLWVFLGFCIIQFAVGPLTLFLCSVAQVYSQGLLTLVFFVLGYAAGWMRFRAFALEQDLLGASVLSLSATTAFIMTALFYLTIGDRMLPLYDIVVSDPFPREILMDGQPMDLYNDGFDWGSCCGESTLTITYGDDRVRILKLYPRLVDGKASMLRVTDKGVTTNGTLRFRIVR